MGVGSSLPAPSFPLRREILAQGEEGGGGSECLSHCSQLQCSALVASTPLAAVTGPWTVKFGGCSPLHI